MFLCKSSKWRQLAQYFSASLMDDRVGRHCAYGSNVLLWVTWRQPLLLTNHEPPMTWQEVDATCRGCHSRGEGLTSQKVLLHLWCVAANSSRPDPCLLPLCLMWEEQLWTKSECSSYWHQRGVHATAPHSERTQNAPASPHLPTKADPQTRLLFLIIQSICRRPSSVCGVIHLNSRTTVRVGVHSVFVEELNHYK